MIARALPRRLPPFRREARAEHRRHGQRHERRRYDRDRHDHRELVEDAADDAAHEQDRQKHGDERKRDGNDRETDLAAPDQRGLEGPHARLDVADDVFEHHDRVVDDETDGKRQPKQRDVVDRKSERIHPRKSSDDRQRDREHRDGSGCHPPQEKEDDEHDEADGQDKRQLNVVHGKRDWAATIVQDVDTSGRAEVGREFGQHRLDLVHDLDRVRVGLTKHRKHERRHAVVAALCLRIGDGVDDVRNILKPHRLAVRRGDDDLAHLGRCRHLGVRLDREVLVGSLDRPGRRDRVRRTDRGGHLVDPDSKAGKRRRVDLGPNRELLRAEDLHLADALKRRQGGRDHLLGEVVELRQRHRPALERNQEDRRVGRVHLPVARRRGHVGRELSERPCDRCLNVRRCLVDVAIEVELDDDCRRPLNAFRADGLNGRDR